MRKIRFICQVIMDTKYSKFLLVKLILILFAAVGSGIVAILFSFTVNDTTDPTFALIITRVAPAVIFYAFMYSFEARIKITDRVLDARYFATFTLREASVYAIFMIPVTLISAFVNIGFVADLLSPHMLAHSLGCGVIVNYVCVVALYAALAALAHYLKSKKPVPVPDVPEEEILESETDDDEDITEKESEDDDEA